MAKPAKGKTAGKPVTLYVSPKGDDAWSGTRATRKRDGTDGPFATVERAQKAIRSLRRECPDAPLTVVLRGGTYFLKKPLVFTSADAGSAAFDGPSFKGAICEERGVTWRAYKDEQPVLSGGRRITGWRNVTIHGRTAWAADLPEVKRGRWNFRQLWVNGERRFRPVLPREGAFPVEAIRGRGDSRGHPWQRTRGKRFVYRKGDLAKWHNLRDVEIVLYNYWIDSRMKLARIDEAQRIATCDRESHQSLENGVYRVENVFEALTEPGEWYLDRTEGVLYYLPKPGESMQTAEVIAPRLAQIVRFDGRPERSAAALPLGKPTQPTQQPYYGAFLLQNADIGRERLLERIAFYGIAFAHTEWSYPDGVAASSQAASDTPGAVSLRFAHRIRFENCTFAHSATYGVELLDGCTDIELRRCTVRDTGAGGVKIWHGCKRNLVADCEIADGGHLCHAGVGVLVGKSSGNRILHNHIHDFYYSGLSIGWTWGYAEGDAYGNVIEYNHVHDLGKGYLSDMGGIYTLGVSPGTRIRHNLFHDITCLHYGGWAIYTDEGSSDVLIEGNLSYRCNSSPFHQHYGRRNVIRNNIWAFGKQCQAALTRYDPPGPAFVFERNLVYFTEGTIFRTGGRAGEPDPETMALRNNLYWNPNRKRLDFCGHTLRQWQRKGMDAGSVVADPEFADPGRGDFRLAKTSPAFRLGFVPLETHRAGPRPLDAIT